MGIFKETNQKKNSDVKADNKLDSEKYWREIYRYQL